LWYKLTERQFFQRAPSRFGEEEVDEDNLEGQPAAIADEISPRGILKSDGIDKGGKEACQSAKELEERNTAGSLGIWPDFDHVSCATLSVPSHLDQGLGPGLTVGQGIIADVVTGSVREDEEDGCDGRVRVRVAGVLCSDGLLHRHSPCDIATEQTDRTRQVHGTTAESSDEQRHGTGADQAPAGVGNVDPLLNDRVGNANHAQEIAEVVSVNCKPQSLDAVVTKLLTR
jgi:hypothetical protein